MNNTVIMMDDTMIVLPLGVTAEQAKHATIEALSKLRPTDVKESPCYACPSDGCATCEHNPNNQGKEDASAVGMLEEAAHCIGDRASERDTEAERSMAATIRAFNGMYGTELTEEQGWQFMVLLKMARAKGGDYRRDDYVDGAAYFALAGECRNDCT